MNDSTIKTNRIHGKYTDVHYDEYGYLSKEGAAYEGKAIKEHYFGTDAKCWLYLLKKEEWRYGKPHESTAKQREAQRLFQQCGLLHRTKQNLRAVQESCKTLELGFAIALVQRYIEKNRAEFDTIEERLGAYRGIEDTVIRARIQANQRAEAESFALSSEADDSSTRPNEGARSSGD